MKKYLLSAFLPLCLLASQAIFSQTVYDTVMGRIRTDVAGSTAIATLDANIATHLSTINANGSWPISYTNADGTHLQRVLDMARGYTRTGSAYQNDAATYTAIVNALQYWYNINPTNTNWWNNDIFFPQCIGQILILMRYAPSQLPTALETDMINRMKKARKIWAGDGANTSDMALHHLYRACLTQNAATMDSAAIYSFDGITFNYAEGLNRDNSFTAHGRQMAINSYGDVFVYNAYNIAAYLYGTNYAISSTKLALLNNFYQNTFVKTFHNGYSDFNTVGRGIARGSGIAHSRDKRVAAYYLADARATDPASSATWDSLASGIHQLQPVHTHYWWSDYDLHIRPSYSFNIRTVSNRTLRTEKGNGENLLGKFLPDGATAIQRLGGEYQNIFPIWEWDKIPGTTSRDFNTDAGCIVPGDWGLPGTTAFVGGVSDSLYGATVYDMDYNGVAAKKSWFFFENEVVCLGAGISSAQSEGITTSVNQSWLYGDIQVKNGGNISTIDNAANSATSFTSPQWVLHDTVGYFFPAGGNITVSNKVQSGSWNRINTGYSATALSGSVFNMWLNHGAAPANASYAYIVAPNLGTAANMDSYDVSNIDIMSNTATVQAVRNKALKIWQLVFYTAGTFGKDGIFVKVDRPCVVMLKDVDGANVTVHVADPGQTATVIKMGIQLPQFTDMRGLDINLPQSPYGGQTVRSVVNNNTPVYQEPEIPQTPEQLSPVADAFVRNGSYANTNYGTNTGLVVKNDAVDYARQSYFKFDPAGITRPISKATLRVYCVGGNTTANTTQWQLYKTASSSWSETGITWNNKPAGTTLVATRTGQTAAGYVDWDVTEAFNSLGTGELLSLQLVSTIVGGNTDATFYSKEAGNASQRPVLLLNTAAPVTLNSVAIADAWVQDADGTGSAVNKNFGSVGYLISQTGGYQRTTYLKFNMKGVSATPFSAKLQLYGSAGSVAGATQWQVYRVSDNSWTEGTGNYLGNGTSGITWANAPTGGTLLATIPSTPTAGYSYWDITDAVKNLGADSILSLRVVSTVGFVYSSFTSREGTILQRPTIVCNMPAAEITVSGSIAPFGNVAAGSSSAVQSYTVSANNLAENLVVNAPPNFQVSTNSSTGFASMLSLPRSGNILATTTVYVRFAPGAGSGATGTLNITHTSAGANTKVITVSGNALATEPETPSLISFSDISGTSLTLHISGGSGNRKLIVAKALEAAFYSPADAVAVTGANSSLAEAAELGGGSKIVYNGADTAAVSITGLEPSTTYYFTVFDYNQGPGASSQNYNTQATGQGNATTFVPITYYRDADGDGFGNADSALVGSSEVPAGYTTNGDDCDDTKWLYADADGDGFGAGAPTACGVATHTDCNDADASVHEPITYYADTDGDGFGDIGNTIAACSATAPAGYTTNNTDFNDADASIQEKPIITVLYKDGDNAVANNQAKPIFQIANQGTAAVAYSKLTVRYWLTAENYSGINTWIDYAQLGAHLITKKYVALQQPRSGAFGYIEYGFATAAGSLQPGASSGQIQSRFATTNYANINEADDYSYIASTVFATNNKMTVYYDGILINGAEPALQTPGLNLVVSYQNQNGSANTNTIRTYVNVVNKGNVAVDYNDLTVRYWFSPEDASSLNYWIDYAAMGNGKINGAFVPASNGIDGYFELKFNASAGSLYPLSNSGNIQYRIAKSNWANFNESNDYSYLPKAAFAENSRMAIYYQGQLVYGTEPAAAPLTIASAAAPVVVEKLQPAEKLKLSVPNLLRRHQTWTISGLQQLTNSRVEVMDQNGRPVFTGKHYNNSRNFSSLAAGIYHYKITGTDSQGKPQLFTGKIVLTD
jgi:chondroitin AC lyase